MFAFQAHDQGLAYTHPALSFSRCFIYIQDVPSGTLISSINYWQTLLDTAPSDDPGDPTTDPDDSDFSNLTNLMIIRH